MAERLSIGVIGVGHLGAHHARILSQSSRWNLAGVFDADAAKNHEVSAQYHLPPCASADEMIARCDAAVVCTPTDSHFAQASAAIRAGIHVFVEKPLVATNEQAAQLQELLVAHRVTGAVGLIERFNPAVLAVRDQIESPRFIEVHRLNAFSPRGLATDIVLEVMIHDIDLACWLVGEEPSEIRAAGVPVLSETDDIANCRLAFPGGCIANLTASRISTSPMRKLRVFSVNRYTSIDLQSKTAETYRLFDEGESVLPTTYAPVASWHGRAIGRHSADVPDANALEAELDDFHSAIVEGRNPRVGVADGARSLKVALAVADACREAAQIARARTPALV
jgi:predicted dehydrogenase